MAMEQSRFKQHATASTAAMTNHIVANLGVLYVKLHQYHWYVQGPKFYTLHAKFEELYNETTANFDAIAERLIALGEKPYSTLGEFLEHATIEESVYDKKIPAEKMVENLVEDYRTIRDMTNRGIELASNENDSITEDLLIGFKEGIELNIWMLQAFLGKDATE